MGRTIAALSACCVLDPPRCCTDACGRVSSPSIRAQHTTFIGVDLGGGKGRNTAVACLRTVDPSSEAAGTVRVEVVSYGPGKDRPLYDKHLVDYLHEHPDALIAMDAPLTLPACVRCQLPVCPGQSECTVPIIRWFGERERARAVENDRKKPLYTPYTQRATEVLLHEVHEILPRETLGQGMGPLTARAAYLQRALRPRFVVGENLIEVYPKATLWQLLGKKTAEQYKRSGNAQSTRLEILNRLTELRFAPGAWREDALQNDHKFDAVICAYTGYLYARGACEPPPSDVVPEDGWIWAPISAQLS